MRTVVSRTSRSRGLTVRSFEDRAGVLRDFVVRTGARLAMLLRLGETLPDDGRWRNSIGSRFGLLVSGRSMLPDLELRATWPARLVFVYVVAVPERPERVLG